MNQRPVELRRLMQLAGLTFREIGKGIGLNQAQVFRALSGEIKLRPEAMRAMETVIVQAARERATQLAAVLGLITPPRAPEETADSPSLCHLATQSPCRDAACRVSNDGSSPVCPSERTDAP